MSSTYITRWEREQARLREQQRKERIQRSWQDNQRKLQSEINAINSKLDRSRFQKELNGIESRYLQAMNDNNESTAQSLIDNLLREIISTQNDEKLLASMRDDFTRLISAIESKSPEYFHDEISKIRSSDDDSLSIEQQIRSIRTLASQVHDLAARIEQVKNISLDGLTEQKFLIQVPVIADKDKADDDTCTQVLQDIFDFFGRTEFYDTGEAARLSPLLTEVENGAALSRLKLIRSQIKAVYNHLREQRTLTDMFKRELQDFLPPLKKSSAQDNERLCRIIEDMMTAPVISRNEYNRICREAASILDKQADESFIQEIAGTLSEMGYNLLDENGEEVSLTADKMFMLDTPYNGYRVRIKASHDNKLVTRLVRVAGSEEEKSSSSEYQKQKDLETSRKWCSDLKKFHSALEGKGFIMHDVMRKDPGDEALDVVVDESLRKQHKTSKTEELHSQERRL